MTAEYAGGYSVKYLVHLAKKLEEYNKRRHAQATIRNKPTWPIPRIVEPSIAARVITALYPWNVDNYPGYGRLLAGVCGVKLPTAEHWLYSSLPMPWFRAQRLRDHIASRVEMQQVMLVELDAYIQERRRIAPVRGRPFVKGVSSASRRAD